MLANDQIKIVARQLLREADRRVQAAGDRAEGRQIWEVARHACHLLESIAEMEEDEMSAGDRARRARYLISELEIGLEAARRAKIALDWSARREE